jgi:hypothetical protein
MKFLRAILRNSDAGVVLGAFLLTGLPILLTGLFEISNIFSLYKAFHKTEGVVVGNKYKKLSETSTSYFPMVVFYTPDETKFQITDPVGTFKEEYLAGDKVPILYEPSAPTNARINTWMRIWFESYIPIGLGILLIAAGFLIARNIIRKAEAGAKK